MVTFTMSICVSTNSLEKKCWALICYVHKLVGNCLILGRQRTVLRISVLPPLPKPKGPEENCTVRCALVTVSVSFHSTELLISAAPNTFQTSLIQVTV